MRQLANVFACQSRAHCATCRDKDNGRSWRESIMQMYEVPGGVVDWECPNGLKWHATSSVIQEAIAAGALTKRPSPPIVRKRISIPPNALLECNICSDQRGCPNVSVCCGGQISVNIQGPCPHGKW